MSIDFEVPGIPVAKARARTVFNKATGRVHSFTPEKTASYENLVKYAFVSKAKDYKLWDGPITLRVNCVFPMPKSVSKQVKLKQIREKTTRPDLDNILKCVKDALNGVAWKDDGQVWSVYASKVESCVENPCLKVCIDFE